jgi:hypothetical protein
MNVREAAYSAVVCVAVATFTYFALMMMST